MIKPHFREREDSPEEDLTSQSPGVFAIGPSPEPVNSMGDKVEAVRAERGQRMMEGEKRSEGNSARCELGQEFPRSQRGNRDDES